MLYDNLNSQAAMMSYNDVFQVMGIIALIAAFVAAGLCRMKPGEGRGH